MEQELISKKDLLTLTGISYGQLYRWKRKDLIPEGWFIKKSTFTGQETFFPKVEILERIDKIQRMKENVSLDDLANMFSPVGEAYKFTAEDLLSKKLISQTVIEFYLSHVKVYQEAFDFDHTVAMYVVESLLQSGDMLLPEGQMVIQLIQDHYFPAENKNMLLILIRKMGISSCLIIKKTSTLHFDGETKVVAQIDFLQIVEELKTKI